MEPLTSSNHTVAAFDFDGTITYRDSLFDFLFFCFGFWRTVAGILYQAPTLFCFTFKLLPRQETKERILTHFFSGKSQNTLSKLGKEFAQKKLVEKIRPDALKRIQWHLEQGHTCVLISASIETYLKPWAEQMGFTHCLTSRLLVGSEGEVTGRLKGLNCRGREKVRRLEEVVGPKENYTLYAYGDSEGDEELLAIADHPFYRRFT